MTTIEKSIEVDVPVPVAYNQWTQFEEFPQFMEGVEEVRQLDAKRLHWKASILGVTREWDAEIVDQTPDQQIAWRAVGGTQNDGVVMFLADPMNTTRTRVRLRLEFEPEGVVEKAGDALHVVERRVQGDLERFKEFIESRDIAPGGWRGEIKPTGEVIQAGGSVGCDVCAALLDPEKASAHDAWHRAEEERNDRLTRAVRELSDLIRDRPTQTGAG